ASLPQRADAEETGHHHGPPKTGTAKTGDPAPATANKVVASDEGGQIAAADPSARADSGTVVGAMEASDHVHAERTSNVGGVKAVPAVRALAKKLGVDLGRVAPSGADGVVTLKDVKEAAAHGTARTGAPATPAPAPARAAPAPAT